MILGMRGSLLSHDALRGGLELRSREDGRSVRRQLIGWHAMVQREAGPAWASRTVFDRIAVPFCSSFGFQVLPAGGEARVCRGVVLRQGAMAAVVAAFDWGPQPGTSWRDSVRVGIAADTRWAFSFAGPTVRIYDARRTHSRRFVEFDLALLCEDERTFDVVWMLLTRPSGLDDAVLLSERHRAGVRDALQTGVHDALRHLTSAFASASRRRSRARPTAAGVLDESLVVIYRILFLLFAEARGLVPAWHAVFRESYTIEALRPAIETRPRPRGVWEALQAIARLAHRGCHAGTLRVPPFNGRLFSPADAPLADSIPLDEGAVRQALLAITTRRTTSGRERIAYSDLGVEQLGGVYERVLDYDIDPHEHMPRLVRGERRRATGSFYTPRSLTEYIVRRTLAPLVENVSPEQILSLRVLDPAMGSGAFLVAACRYLAIAYEASLVADGGLTAGDVSEADRAGFRRAVAQRCLYGVDVNPMAVQLARLSLWLATLSHDRPLTFFDHHLRAGNSLIGASIADVRRRRAGRHSRTSPLPLFDDETVSVAVGSSVSTRELLRMGVEETLEHVREKERIFAGLESDGAPLARWKAIADLWCGAWFDANARRFNRAAFEALIDLASGRYVLSEAVANGILTQGRETARALRFFHWELEFPEAFYDGAGEPLMQPGFDAVLGNPPWEMVRGDSGDGTARMEAARVGSALTRFARGSGIFHMQGEGHANLYQMFAERALRLVRPGGRLGLVLPSGFASDHGCAALRRSVLHSSNIDSFVVAENREALFPIHRGLKFVLMTLTKSDCGLKAEGTSVVPLRTGIRSAADFDRLPDDGPDPDAVPASVELIERFSGEQFAIPELRTPMDARIVSQIAFSFSAAGCTDGWGLRFGRELNATDDRGSFNSTGNGLPVIEGKHVQPFTVAAGSTRHHVDVHVAERLLSHRPFERSRLAYRDVASSTNRLTLIAAVLPAGTVTTHTLFVLRTRLDEEAQQFVAGMFNSFVANYVVRLRVTTHVTVAIVEQLPLPMPRHSSVDFRIVAGCARVLADRADDRQAYARLQAAAARLYGLDAEAFAHVLSTFPLIDEGVREASMDAFTRTV
ncbi:MAG TPA: N-6 DNA methylase [Vicinamibacterales bacterium]|nr:N-6 DNA methylase [Vicinamibacterales bacterium]